MNEKNIVTKKPLRTLDKTLDFLLEHGYDPYKDLEIMAFIYNVDIRMLNRHIAFYYLEKTGNSNHE